MLTRAMWMTTSRLSSRRRRRVGKARKSVEMVTQSIQTDVVSEPAVEAIDEETLAEPTVEVKVTFVPARSALHSFSAAVTSRTMHLAVLLFAIGLSLGLLLNTSRDIYHVNHQSLDADEFRS